MKLAEIKSTVTPITGVVAVVDTVTADAVDPRNFKVYGFWRKQDAATWYTDISPSLSRRGDYGGLRQCHLGLVIKPWVVIVASTLRIFDNFDFLAIGKTEDEVRADFEDELPEQLNRFGVEPAQLTFIELATD